MTTASAQPVPNAKVFSSSSAVSLSQVDYRPRQLSIHLERPDGGVVAVFEGVLGYRVLDERDLGFLLNQYKVPGGWLYEVSGGGWRTQEEKRWGFISPQIFDEVVEYLVTSESECVSVLVDHRDPPAIELVRSNTSLERTRER